jgi:hypothetical protein
MSCQWGILEEAVIERVFAAGSIHEAQELRIVFRMEGA